MHQGLHIEDTGTGVPVLFSPGLLMTTRMYDAQVAHLHDRYRCVVYDHRGQGRSTVPRERTIGMELLYADVVAMIESLDLAPCHFVGLSMGGFLGIRLGARRPDLLRSLTLMNTTAGPEDPAQKQRFRMMNLAAGLLGSGVVVARVMPILFGRRFLSDPARRDEVAAWRARLAHPRSITRAVRGVLERDGVEDELAAVKVRTMVIHGEADAAISLREGERLAAAIPGAVLEVVAGAGHSTSVEMPDRVNELLEGFLDG